MLETNRPRKSSLGVQLVGRSLSRTQVQRRNIRNELSKLEAVAKVTINNNGEAANSANAVVSRHRQTWFNTYIVAYVRKLVRAFPKRSN